MFDTRTPLSLSRCGVINFGLLSFDVLSGVFGIGCTDAFFCSGEDVWLVGLFNLFGGLRFLVLLSRKTEILD
jgi:hypothetical protein